MCAAGGTNARLSRPLATLAEVAPVFLWSIVGAENGTRLLGEFPDLGRYVAGAHGKVESLLETVEQPFAIDDELVADEIQARYS